MHLFFAIIVAGVTGGTLLVSSVKNHFLSVDIVLMLIAGLVASMYLVAVHYRRSIFDVKMASDLKDVHKRDVDHKLSIQQREIKRLKDHQLGLVNLVVFMEDQLLNGRGRIYNRLTLSAEHRNLLQIFAPSDTPVPAKPKEPYTGPERRHGRISLKGHSIESADVRHDHVSAAIAASPPSAD